MQHLKSKFSFEAIKVTYLTYAPYSLFLFYSIQRKVDSKQANLDTNVKEYHEKSEKYSDIYILFLESKAGLESLMEKLTFVKTLKKSEALKPGTQEEYLTEIFDIIKRKIQALLTELSGYDVNDYLRKMETKEVIYILVNFIL